MPQKKRSGDITLDKTAATSISGTGDEWVDIQRKTFTNWANEQLRVSGRTIQDVGIDFCDGVNLVALVEALQFRKIGRVYASPKSRIQMLQNVGLAFKAISEENIRMVNIGSEDVVNGNMKLTLGLLWHLIMRYQLASTKSKAPPKKLMLSWFKNILPEVEMSNFPSDWRDGILLHALLNRLKPGISPDWRQLHRKNAVENCTSAMKLAREHFNIPRVIAPEDFASAALDDLSAMTYLSYFIKVDSPGYYEILNWVCRQLRTTQITNLTTDWNDGYYLCSIVNSYGGHIAGWPNLDRTDCLGNCQKGIDGAKALGVEPVLSAAEMADPNLDHLSVMAYLSKFQNIAPQKSNSKKVKLSCTFKEVPVWQKVTFRVDILEKDVKKEKVKVQVYSHSTKVDCDVTWKDKFADCKFSCKTTGEHKIHLHYDDEEVEGSPHAFNVIPDKSKIKLVTESGNCRLRTDKSIRVVDSGYGAKNISMTASGPSQIPEPLLVSNTSQECSAVFKPTSVGQWVIRAYLDEDQIAGSPINISVYDPEKALLEGPGEAFLGEEILYTVCTADAGDGDIQTRVTNNDVTLPSTILKQETGRHIIKFKPLSSGKLSVRATFNNDPIVGSPKEATVQDLSRMMVETDGVRAAQKGVEATFTINTGGKEENIDVRVSSTKGETIHYTHRSLGDDRVEYGFIPRIAGKYDVTVLWNDRHIKGSPFYLNVGDRTKITLLTDLTELIDDVGKVALDYDKLVTFRLDIADAGQGLFNAEVLGPKGKLPVQKKQDESTAEFSFKAVDEGDHYIHMYYSQIPLDISPLRAYCPGRPLPIDHRLVHVEGHGTKSARAGVPAEFFIDGHKAGPGVPKIKLHGVRQDVDVSTKDIKYDRYRCTYTAPSAGSYLLYVRWSDEEVPGSPFKVTVTLKGNHQKVTVFGDGLKGGIVGHELRVGVDTRKAGTGEISASCTCGENDARCEVFDHGNNTYTVRIFPTITGRHSLNIRYDNDKIPGSPFSLSVGEPLDPEKVRVFGPGIEDGVIQTFESRFLVDTKGAGAGQLAVRIRGPRGGFKVEMERGDDTDRTVLCKYDPTEGGEYTIYVKWSGYDVPGSPFQVQIFESLEELAECLKRKGLISNRDSNFLWSDEI